MGDLDAPLLVIGFLVTFRVLEDFGPWQSSQRDRCFVLLLLQEQEQANQARKTAGSHLVSVGWIWICGLRSWLWQACCLRHTEIALNAIEDCALDAFNAVSSLEVVEL